MNNAQNRGVTLITLIVTIVVMFILASVATYYGIDTIEQSKVVKFITEMKVVQSRVNYIYERIAQDTGDEFLSKGTQVTGSLANYTQIQTAINAVNIECNKTGEISKDIANFKYYTIQDLKDIGIDTATQDMVIDLTRRDVISIDGIKYDGKMYYRHFDLGEGNNIEYKEQTQIPTFSLEKRIYGLNAKITIKDLVYAQNIENGRIYYSKVDVNNPSQNTWSELQGTELNISETGNYRFKVIDSMGNSSAIEETNVTLINSPKLATGMTPVIWDESKQKWRVTSEIDGLWYDYEEQKGPTESGGTAKWANVMLQDGLTVDTNGYVTSLGSMFVWIPRYMYNIKSGWHTSTAGEIDVKFLKGTSNIPTDNTNVKISTTSGQDNWLVHPAFQDGTLTGFPNGEWDKEITGIWVGKSETGYSGATTEVQSQVTSTTPNKVSIKDNTYSWTNIPVSNMFKIAKEMKDAGNIYGLINNADTHMLKNSEWGAATYLGHSKYGRNGTEVHVNSSGSFVAGGSYKTNINQSTTGNITGIYDMVGGCWEYVMGMQSDSLGSTGLSSFPERKYYNSYLSNQSIYYGDAMYETSTLTNESSGWFTDRSSFISTGPCIMRGGYSSDGSTTGIFAYYGYAGGQRIYETFRVAIIVDNF